MFDESYLGATRPTAQRSPSSLHRKAMKLPKAMNFDQADHHINP